MHKGLHHQFSMPSGRVELESSEEPEDGSTSSSSSRYDEYMDEYSYDSIGSSGSESLSMAPLAIAKKRTYLSNHNIFSCIFHKVSPTWSPCTLFSLQSHVPTSEVGHSPWRASMDTCTGEVCGRLELRNAPQIRRGFSMPQHHVKYSGTKGMLNDVEFKFCTLKTWTSLRHARVYQQDASNLPAVGLQWCWRGIPLTAENGPVQVPAHVFVPCLVCVALITKYMVCFRGIFFKSSKPLQGVTTPLGHWNLFFATWNHEGYFGNQDATFLSFKFAVFCCFSGMQAFLFCKLFYCFTESSKDLRFHGW